MQRRISSCPAPQPSRAGTASPMQAGPPLPARRPCLHSAGMLGRGVGEESGGQAGVWGWQAITGCKWQPVQRRSLVRRPHLHPQPSSGPAATPPLAAAAPPPGQPLRQGSRQVTPRSGWAVAALDAHRWSPSRHAGQQRPGPAPRQLAHLTGRSARAATRISADRAAAAGRGRRPMPAGKAKG